MKGRPTDRSRVGRFHNVEEKGNWVKEKDRKPTLEIRRQRSVRSLSLFLLIFSTDKTSSRKGPLDQTNVTRLFQTHTALLLFLLGHGA